MKEGKSECAKPPRPPKPNLKNKEFVKWSRTESCKQSDNLVATDWHERLQKTPMFTPMYDNAPTNMVYLLSGEYGRMWEKERTEWYSKVFVLNPKEKDMNERKKKIRKQAREAKKAAEVNIQERKARRAKELEAKAKADLERAEKQKAKLAKCAARKKPKKQDAKQGTVGDAKSSSDAVESANEKTEDCPKGWTPVELTLQCECSHHKKEEPEKPPAENQDQQVQQSQTQPESEKEPAQPTICEDYIKQLASIQNKKDQEATETLPP